MIRTNRNAAAVKHRCDLAADMLLVLSASLGDCWQLNEKNVTEALVHVDMAIQFLRAAEKNAQTELERDEAQPLARVREILDEQEQCDDSLGYLRFMGNVATEAARRFRAHTENIVER